MNEAYDVVLGRAEIPALAIYPAGCDPDHHDSHSFGVHVTWRGKGRWSVDSGASQLSQTGRWLYFPMKMHRRFVRHDFQTAVSLARNAVDHVTVNGRTWAEWQAEFARRKAEEATNP